MPAANHDQFDILDIADRFFLMCHTHDGDVVKPRLQQRGIDLGLAAALLAESIASRGIDIYDGYVVPLNPHAQVDRLGRVIMRDLVREEPRDVRTWLEYLGQTSRRMVGDRLQAKGVLARTHRRGILPGTAKTRYQTVDPKSALVLEATVLSLLSGEYSGQSTSEMTDITVAMLAQATGLGAGWSDYHRAQLDRLGHSLPHPLHQLIRLTEAAVAGATIHRR